MSQPSKLNDASSALALLKSRKSASVKAMAGPGPTRDQIDEILAIAVRVPDHGKLMPWRFILFEGKAREAFGQRLRQRWKALHPDHGAEALEFQQGFFLRAPVVLAVICKAGPHVKIPEWEQMLSNGAVCQTILFACAALGIDAQWQTDWPAYDREIARLLKLGAQERVTGFIYMGTSTVPLEDRPRADPKELLTVWEG